MPPAFKEVAVVRNGDAKGNRMVAKLTTQEGVDIHAIAVPQDWASRTGPTWTYLLESDGLTLIDAGAAGSFPELVDGIRQAGFQPKDIERVVITHGHWDHDGAAAQLAQGAGVEVWAHDIYAHLLPYEESDIQRHPLSPIQQEMHKVADANIGERRGNSRVDTADYQSRRRGYMEARRGLQVAHGVRSHERFGKLTFLHAPGHSPDGVCVTFDGLVFTGDHVLPEITPHPTTKLEYAADVRSKLPAEYREADRYYGLATYLRSLRAVDDMGPHVTVLPAHRLFNGSRFNFQSASRAGELIQHHARRLRGILHRIGSQPATLETVTRGIFQRSKLIGGNLYMALTEVVAHIELLQDAGDLEVTRDSKLRWTGGESYLQLIHDLTRP